MDRYTDRDRVKERYSAVTFIRGKKRSITRLLVCCFDFRSAAIRAQTNAFRMRPYLGGMACSAFVEIAISCS